MDTTRLSSRGQVIIPKTVRNARRWLPGQELLVIDTGDGILLKPKRPFQETSLDEVVGWLQREGKALSDDEIAEAVRKGVREAWHGGG